MKIFILVAILGCGSLFAMQPNQSKPLASIIDLRLVAKVKVINFPEENRVRAALSPEMLEGMFERDLVFDRDESAEWVSFTRAFEATRVAPSDGVGDMRWGIFFYDINGERIAQLAIDRKKRIAVLGTQSLKIQGGFLDWLPKINAKLQPR